jgi:hypothetical protein
MSELSKKHDEFMAMSAEELNIWAENTEIDAFLNAAELSNCPWILIPKNIGSTIPSINKSGKDPVVPIRWFMGEVSWYIVEYDGEDTVNAFISDDIEISPQKTHFSINKLGSLTMFSETETWRVYRDTNWNPNTRLSDIMKTFIASTKDKNTDDDEDLVF